VTNCELANRWSVVRLDEACEVILGQSPPGESYNTKGKGLPFFQGKAEFGDLYPAAVKWCTKPSKLAQKDDVLISVRAPVGPTNLCPSEACIGRGLAALRPRNGIPPRYVLYALRNNVHSLTEQATGSTFEAISGKQLRGHTIPLAPSSEWQRIVAEIEKQFTRLDAGVASLKRLQSALKRYRASVFKAACEGRLVTAEAELAQKKNRSYESADILLQRILKQRREKWSGKRKYKEPVAPDTSSLQPLAEGWAWAAVGQLIIEPLCNGISIKGSNTGPGVRALRLSAMSDAGFDYSNSRFLPLSEADVDDLWIEQGDFFISRGNGSLHLVGRGTTAQQPPEATIFPDTMIRARWSKVVRETRWISMLWPSRVIRNQIEQKVKTTAGIYKIAQPQVEEMAIPFPPLAEQKRIVAEVERRLSVVDELKALVSANLQRATRLRQSILQAAFTGSAV
jgi:type I restriction enzyme S subunit